MSLLLERLIVCKTSRNYANLSSDDEATQIFAVAKKVWKQTGALE